MSLWPVLLGLLASALALGQLLAFAAIGALLIPPGAARLPTLILLGAAVCGALAALLCWAGLVRPAALTVALLGLGAALLRRQRLAQELRECAAALRALVGGHRLARWPLLITLAVYWLVAVAPPRDADVLRYHLAHVRQIIMDGAWLPIPDYHYALPFGFTLTYLPFELVGVPQAAHMLNLGLLLVCAVAVFSAVRPLASWPVAYGATLLFILHPHVLRSATTARADMYIILVMLAATLPLLRLAELKSTELALLGFVAWVGAQSRYQAIAIGLAVSAVLLVTVVRRRLPPQALLPFGLGSAGALLLSAPFYAFNWRNLGDPVWPLLTGVFHKTPTYADLVVGAFNAGLNGSLTPRTLLRGVAGLLTDPTVFPIPILALGLALLALRGLPLSARPVGLLTAVFLLIWGLTQPNLYPRFSLILAAPVTIGWVPLAARWSGVAARRLLVIGSGLLLLGCAIFNLYYAGDYLRYAVSGDAARFHQHTWFAPVYDWANQQLPPDARVLVIVSSAQSYYLERDYRRADPETSGVLDWRTIPDGPALDTALASGGYTHIIFQDTGWRRFVGGANVGQSIEDAERRGLIRQLQAFDTNLSTSRVAGNSTIQHVQIFARTRS